MPRQHSKDLLLNLLVLHNTDPQHGGCVVQSKINSPWIRDSFFGQSARLMIKWLQVQIPAEAAGEFSSSESTFVLTLIRCPFHSRVTAVARKVPSHSAKTAGGRLHLNTHAFLTQRSRSGLTMLLSRHSVGTYQETSSHETRQGTLGHSHLSSLSHCGLILA